MCVFLFDANTDRLQHSPIYETSTMHETHTIAATPPPAGRYILSSLATYDGIGADEYIELESKIDNIFSQCHMCEW